MSGADWADVLGSRWAQQPQLASGACAWSRPRDLTYRERSDKSLRTPSRALRAARSTGPERHRAPSRSGAYPMAPSSPLFIVSFPVYISRPRLNVVPTLTSLHTFSPSLLLYESLQEDHSL